MQAQEDRPAKRQRRRLIQRRKAAGLTQEALAERIRVDRSTIFRWEYALCDPQPWHRPGLGKALGISAEELEDILREVPVLLEPMAVAQVEVSSPHLVDAVSVGRASTAELTLMPSESEVVTVESVPDQGSRAGHVRESVPREPRPTGKGRPSAHSPGSADHAMRSLFQLPPDIVDFTGRGVETRSLVRMLTEPVNATAVPVAVVSGAGGIGKTTVAIHGAHQISSSFPDGQLYVDLRGENEPSRPTNVLDTFLRELGVEAIPDVLDERARLFRSQLAGRQVLVVLDNAVDERQVRPLLPGTAGCAVVITSRRRLMGLSGASHVALKVMTVDQSLDLMRSVIGTHRVGAELGSARDIVSLCGRLPLALRIAAARLASRPHEPLRVFVQRLRDERNRLNLLTAGDLEVRASFALSYDECDPETRRAFRLLGLVQTPTFASWTLAALADVTDADAQALLERLVDAELVEIAASEPSEECRYRLHDLLRVYAGERIQVDPYEERREAVSRLLGEYVRVGAHAVVVATPANMELAGPRLPPGLIEVPQAPWGWAHAERIALTTGTQIAVDFELWETAWQLAELLPLLLRWQSDGTDWSQMMALGLDAAHRCGSREGQARVRCSLSLLYRAQGRFKDAITELTSSAAIFAEMGDELRAAVVQRQLGDTYRYTGRLEDGVVAFERSLTVFESHNSRRMAAGTLNGLGDILRGLSRWDDSVACFTRSIALYTALDDRLEVARAKVRFGLVYRDQCLYEQAEELLIGGRSTLRILDDPRWEARAARHLGIVYRNTGRISEAFDMFAYCLKTFTSIADWRGIAVTLRNLGDTHRYAEDVDPAERNLLDALGRFQHLGDNRWQARTHVSVATTIAHHGRWAEATEHLEAAASIYDRIGDMPGQARAHRSYGVILRQQQRWDESQQAFQAAQDLFSSLGDRVWQARTIAGASLTRKARGDDSWRGLHEDAIRQCRRAGATSDTQAETWLHEW